MGKTSGHLRIIDFRSINRGEERGAPEMLANEIQRFVKYKIRYEVVPAVTEGSEVHTAKSTGFQVRKQLRAVNNLRGDQGNHKCVGPRIFCFMG